MWYGVGPRHKRSIQNVMVTMRVKMTLLQIRHTTSQVKLKTLQRT